MDRAVRGAARTRHQSVGRVRRAAISTITAALICVALGACTGRRPPCDGDDANAALQSLFAEQTARILQHYAFDQSDPLQMVRMGTALDLGLADDGVTLMLRPEDAAKIKWQFEVEDATGWSGSTQSCAGRATYSRGQFSGHFPIKFELRYTKSGEIDISLLN